MQCQQLKSTLTELNDLWPKLYSQQIISFTGIFIGALLTKLIIFDVNYNGHSNIPGDNFQKYR